MDEGIIIRCPNCGTKNRIPAGKVAKQGICGRCGNRLPLPPSHDNGSVEISDSNFASEVINFAGPVLVEFTAPW